MAKLNWTRLIIGGLVAAAIMFFTDGFFHEKVVIADWQAVYAGLRAAEPDRTVLISSTSRSSSLVAG